MGVTYRSVLKSTSVLSIYAYFHIYNTPSVPLLPLGWANSSIDKSQTRGAVDFLLLCCFSYWTLTEFQPQAQQVEQIKAELLGAQKGVREQSLIAQSPSYCTCCMIPGFLVWFPSFLLQTHGSPPWFQSTPQGWSFLPFGLFCMTCGFTYFSSFLITRNLREELAPSPASFPSISPLAILIPSPQKKPTLLDCIFLLKRNLGTLLFRLYLPYFLP